MLTMQTWTCSIQWHYQVVLPFQFAYNNLCADPCVRVTTWKKNVNETKCMPNYQLIYPGFDIFRINNLTIIQFYQRLADNRSNNMRIQRSKFVRTWLCQSFTACECTYLADKLYISYYYATISMGNFIIPNCPSGKLIVQFFYGFTVPKGINCSNLHYTVM